MPNDSSRPGYERNPPDPRSPTHNQSISQAPNDKAVDILCGALPKLPSYFLDEKDLGLDGPPVELDSIVPCSAVGSRGMFRLSGLPDSAGPRPPEPTQGLPSAQLDPVHGRMAPTRRPCTRALATTTVVTRPTVTISSKRAHEP